MDHYFSEEPESDLRLFDIKVHLKNDSPFTLVSASGLFSKDELDFATKVLIENSIIPKSGNVLDLGCGNGVVGISLLRRNPDLKLFFVDVNTRATDVTKENLRRLNLNAVVKSSDLFEKVKDKFDLIISNPPIAAGRQLCFKLIEESISYLNDGGSLQIVARHNKGGKVLQDKMDEVFGNVKTLQKSGGFRVYMSVKE